MEHMRQQSDRKVDQSSGLWRACPREWGLHVYTNTLQSVVRRVQLSRLAVTNLETGLSVWCTAAYVSNVSGYSCCFFSALPSAPQCDNCGIEPIQGVRWHCQDCPQEMSLDFCDSCSDWWAAYASTCYLQLSWISPYGLNAAHVGNLCSSIGHHPVLGKAEDPFSHICGRYIL